MPTTIEEVIAAQRAKLVKGEYALTSRIGGAYKAASAEATRRLELTGSDFTKQRMSILLSNIEDELTKAAGKSIPMIKEHQAAVQIQAGKDIAQLMPAGFDLGVRFDPLANERMFAALSPESPLAELLSKANIAGLTKARMALFTGVALGDNPLKIAPKLRDALDIPRWRAETIARTEVLRSYRGSVRERMRQIDGIEKWRWIAACDANTCAMCWAMHGTIHEVTETLDSHPNCRCSQAPVASQDVGELGEINGAKQFEALDDSAQRNILGGAKFKAYQDGVISLGDLVGTRKDSRWGTVRYEKSLISILGNNAPVYYKGGVTPSNFQKQMLKAHEMASAAKAAADAEIAKLAEQAAAQAAKTAAEKIAAAKSKASLAAKKGAVTAAANKLAAAQQTIINAKAAGDVTLPPGSLKKLQAANKLAAKYGLPTKSYSELLAAADQKAGAALVTPSGNIFIPDVPTPVTTHNVPPAGSSTTANAARTVETRGGAVTPAEYTALKDYQDGYYSTWNRQLRANRVAGIDPLTGLSTSDQSRIRALDGLLERSTVQDAVLYRRVRTPFETLQGVGFEEGYVHFEAGYSSTSAHKALTAFGESTYVITMPAGAKGGYLMPTMGIEDERLLPRNAKFRIDRVDAASKTFYMTYLGV